MNLMLGVSDMLLFSLDDIADILWSVAGTLLFLAFNILVIIGIFAGIAPLLFPWLIFNLLGENRTLKRTQAGAELCQTQVELG